MNKVILIGRLCNEVETRRTQSGKAVASYRLAVDRQFKQDGQPEADFLNCVAFGSNGEFAGKYLTKGMKIAIEGRIQTRTYDDKDGKKVYVTEIIVEHHEFCEKKAESSGNTYGQQNGGYNAPTYPATPASDFAMLDDDDAQLPF
jgi:single-strand DNA-binding protein